MKLEEFIVQLQKIAKSKPQAEVAFELARVDGVGITTRTLHLLAINDRYDTACLALGNSENDAAQYKEHVETLKRQGCEKGR